MNNKNILKWLGMGANVIVFLAAIVDAILLGLFAFVSWVPMSVEGFARKAAGVLIILSMAFIIYASWLLITKKTYGNRYIYFISILIKVLLLALSYLMVGWVILLFNAWHYI